MKVKLFPSKAVGFILLIGLVHGLVYVFLMPPWQHYDEPTHFEYAWLLANRWQIPQAGDYDPGMRLDVAQSMIEHEFYAGLNYLPDLEAPDGKVDIGGYSQLDEPPVYYILAAIPVALLRTLPVTTQLYGARLVSTVLLVVSIGAVYGMVSELTRPGNPLRWIIPGGMALLPGYVELMSAINNDVGAAAFMSLALWGTVKLAKKGWHTPTVIWSGIAAGLCLLVKETAYLAVPLWFLGVILSLLRKSWTWGVWIGFIIACGAAFVAIFGWGDALFWYRSTFQSDGTRAPHTAAPLGQAVFMLTPDDPLPSGGSRLSQLVPGSTTRDLRGKVVTVGAWIWADEPMSISMPVLTAFKTGRDADRTVNTIEISTIPVFYAYQASVPENTSTLHLHLENASRAADQTGKVYYDGIVLALGEYPVDEAPAWDGPLAQSGTWGDMAVTNLLRNASAEDIGPRVKPWVDRIGSRVIPDSGRPSLILYSVIDNQAAGSYYRSTAKMMLQTFWGRFGWGHVLLDGEAVYAILGWVSLLALVGCCAVFWDKFAPDQVSPLLLLGLALLGVWGIAVVRGAIYIFNLPFIPGARYAFPVIGPTLVILGYGWWSVLKLLGKLLKLKTGVLLSVLGLAFLALDFWSVISIWRYYAG